MRRLLAHALALCLVVTVPRLPAPAQTQNNPSKSQPSTLTGHYEGTATNKDHEVIPLVIDLMSSGGILSGRVSTPLGTFPIGGNEQSGSATASFDAGGERGTINATLDSGKLVGHFALGDDGGPIEAKKTSDIPVTDVTVRSPFATPIMFLGVYHMHNPGLDAVNLQADDVLSSKRQREIEELVERLSHFHPTKIAIEAPYRDATWPDLYQKFLAGQYTLGRNEIEQVAFRLAKRLNLSTLYGVDYQMFMNGLTPSEMADPKPARSDPEGARPSEPLSPEDELLRHSTVTEYLRHLNSTAEIHKNHESYMTILLPNNDPAIYRRTDLVSNWYKRNLRIFANINRIAEPGKDRILVLIGAGHLKLLKEFAADAPYFADVDAESFLKP